MPSLRVISWVFYIVGIALVLGQWVGLVPTAIGWMGWVIGMIGWGLQFFPAARRKP